MSAIELTCIECPMGCRVTVTMENGKAVKIDGNGCPRGKLYAENEVICPMRVVTTTVMTDKRVPVSVKTDKPVKKAEMFNVMKKINSAICKTPVKIGDVIIENISDGANVVATSDIN